MGANKKIPMRQCVGCQEMKNKKEMIRVIRTSEGEFLLDATGRKNGRGAYICPNQECLKKAVLYRKGSKDRKSSACYCGRRCFRKYKEKVPGYV